MTEKARPRRNSWAASGITGRQQTERHYDGREFLAYTDRPHDLDVMLGDALARYPEREAIVVDDLRIGFGQLSDLVDNTAKGIAALGLLPGDRVALLLGNCWEFVVSFIACVRLGLICAPIGTRYKAKEIEYLLNDCGAKLLIFAADLAVNLPPPEVVPKLLHRYAVGGPAQNAAPFSRLQNSEGSYLRHDSHEEDPVLILYTSGTAGRPKGAVLTHLGVIHSVLTFIRCFGLNKEDRSIVSVPLAHVTGLVGALLPAIAVGGAAILMRAAYKTTEFLELVSRERVTFVIAVPTIYTLCVNDPNFDCYDLSNWRAGCFGGAPMPEATVKVLAEKLPRLALSNSYGATETTAPVAIMPAGENMKRLDSVGQIVPYDEVIIVDPDGKPVPPGAHGELWIRGPNVVPGYWNNPDADVAGFIDGYWHSGDIGSVDELGYVRIFDRIKDMINRAGLKVYCAEVENVLNGHRDVLECAVIGRPDPVLGERVHAFVVPKPGTRIATDDVQRYCADLIADYKVPETIQILNEALPRNANGKVQKAVLRERLRTKSVS